MNSFLFQTAMSVPFLKMTFRYQYNAPRVLYSTTNYGHECYFEQFGALLDIDWSCRLIVHLGESSLFCCVIAIQFAVLAILVSLESTGH